MRIIFIGVEDRPWFFVFELLQLEWNRFFFNYHCGLQEIKKSLKSNFGNVISLPAAYLTPTELDIKSFFGIKLPKPTTAGDPTQGTIKIIQTTLYDNHGKRWVR